MDRGGVKPFWGVEVGAGTGLGVVELRNGADALVWRDHGGDVSNDIGRDPL